MPDGSRPHAPLAASKSSASATNTRTKKPGKKPGAIYSPFHVRSDTAPCNALFTFHLSVYLHWPGGCVCKKVQAWRQVLTGGLAAGLIEPRVNDTKISYTREPSTARCVHSTVASIAPLERSGCVIEKLQNSQSPFPLSDTGHGDALHYAFNYAVRYSLTSGMGFDKKVLAEFGQYVLCDTSVSEDQATYAQHAQNHTGKRSR